MKFVGIADSKQIFVLARSSKELIGFCSIFFFGGGGQGWTPCPLSAVL